MRKSFLGIYKPLHKFVVFLLDTVALALAFYLASLYRLDSEPDFFSFEYIGLNLIIVASLFLGNAYTSYALIEKPKLPLRTFFTVLASAAPCTIFIYLSGPENFTSLFGRGVFPAAILIFGVASILIRLICNELFRMDNDQRKIAIVGAMKKQRNLQLAMEDSIHGFTLDYLPLLVNVEDYDAIVMTPDHVSSDSEQLSLIDARLNGIPIFSLSDFIESFLFLVPVNEINNNWIIRADGFKMLHSTITTRLKRFFDIVTALTLLVITFPLCILTAILIKISSKGPSLFSQTRVGLQGRTFTLFKFRTMRTDAEEKGPRWASKNDPRVFPLGRFLRATRIDELPQCWNILKGEMSLIGPRPERPEFTGELTKEIPYYDLRHLVKPGLSGWAQVCYPYGASKEDALKKLQYDLYYIKNYSLILDLNIVLRTVLVTMSRSGR